MEYGGYVFAAVHHARQPGSTLRTDIADLDAALFKHCDRVLVVAVARFAAKFDRVAGAAQANTEAAAGTALVRVVSADNGEGELRAGQAANWRPSRTALNDTYSPPPIASVLSKAEFQLSSAS